MASYVHRAGLSGGPICGATGRVRLSFSGANNAVTCPACKPSGPAVATTITAELAANNPKLAAVWAALQPPKPRS